MNRPHYHRLIIVSAALVLPLLVFSEIRFKDTVMNSTRPANGASFSVLSANVGNSDLRCRNYIFKLCYKDAEERIAANIQALSADIIALQEVLPPWMCDQVQENNKNKVCSELQVIPQVRRLVGADYTIACTSRNQFECIAVKTDVGEILGCEPGSLCNTARTGAQLPGCSDGFSVSAVTIRLKDGFQFDLVNAHPQSFNAGCRAKMLALILEGNSSEPALIREEKVLLLGDFNLDPWRDHDESARTWRAYFEKGHAGQPFRYHSGIAEKNPPYVTLPFFLARKTLDLAVSNFADGVFLTLGESPGTKRLDGGHGMDHRAIFGTLSYRPAR
jgi:hypothetical protein